MHRLFFHSFNSEIPEFDFSSLKEKWKKKQKIKRDPQTKVMFQNRVHFEVGNLPSMCLIALEFHPSLPMCMLCASSSLPTGNKWR